MSTFKKVKPFDREVLNKYHTGGLFINSTPKPSIKSIAFWIQLVSAPLKTIDLVAEHIADCVMINGIPHVQSTLKKQTRVMGWVRSKLKINYPVQTVLLSEYLTYYDFKTNIYYCPLSEEAMKVFDEKQYLESVELIDNAPYASVLDLIQTGIDNAHIDWLDKYLKILPFYKSWIPSVLKWAMVNKASQASFTCSKSVSFKACDNYLEYFNYSEDTPQDIAEKKTFPDLYYLIQGKVLKPLHNFNTKEVLLKGE